MALWRCPHCGAPQPETARCWVCRRSTTSCATCRHYRQAVAAGLGYCGLDRRRLPLVGDEIRGCWEGGAVAEPHPTVVMTLHHELGARGFVPVESPGPAIPSGPASTDLGPPLRIAHAAPRWSLWPDPE